VTDEESVPRLPRKQRSPDAYSSYFNDVSKVKILDAETEHELFLRYKKHHDLQARDRIIESCLRFVVKLARKYSGGNNDFMLDLISAGNLGLLKALGRYNPQRGTRFLTYATNWVMLYIRDELQNCDLVTIPVWRQKAIRKVRRARAHVAAKEGREASTREISCAAGLSETSIRSLDTDHFKYAPEETCDQRILALQRNAPPDEQIIRKQQREIVQKLLSLLSIKDRTILCNYYGLVIDAIDDGHRKQLFLEVAPWSLRRIGQTISVTSERVRQRKALLYERLARFLLTKYRIHEASDICPDPK
jgi:RNA polymerase primary sigma factor